MDILELEHKHGIEDLKRDIGDNREPIRDMDRRVEHSLQKWNDDSRYSSQKSIQDSTAGCS